MLLCRVYHVIAIYPETMGKRQGINEQEKFGNQSSTADKKLKMNEFLALSTRPWSRFSMLELLFVKIHGQKIARLCVETSAVPKNYPLVAKPQLKSERWLCSFPGIIRIAFGNEVPLTPKRISSLERSTFSLFFEKSIVD